MKFAINYAVIAAFLIGTVAGQMIHISFAQVAEAQSSVPPAMAAVVATCGTLAVSYSANTLQPITQNTSGQLCVSQ